MEPAAYSDEFDRQVAEAIYSPGRRYQFVSVYTDGTRVTELVGIPLDAEAIYDIVKMILKFRDDQDELPRVEIKPVAKGQMIPAVDEE